MKYILNILFLVSLANVSFSQRVVKFEKNEYNVGVIAFSDSLQAITNDKVLLEVRYSFFTHIEEEVVPEIDEQLGPQYTEILVVPILHSIVRETMGKYSFDQILSSKREFVSQEIFERASQSIKKYKIHLKDVLISEIILPPAVEAAMMDKVISEQALFIQKNKLEKAKIEADILAVEAKAQARYNLILDSGLTDKVLRLKYIEALKEIAKSPQSKTIVIDGNSTELLRIFDGDSK